MQKLKEQAGQNRFPEVPRRQYERRQETDLPNDHGERHVRSRHHLQPDIAGLRLHREEKIPLGEAGRFRVISVKDASRAIYAGNDRALRSDLRFLESKGLVSVDIVNARHDGRSRSVERVEVITLTRAGEKLTQLNDSFAPDQNSITDWSSQGRPSMTRRSTLPIRKSGRRSRRRVAAILELFWTSS